MATFDSTKNALPKILEAITEGKVQLPDFQRGWVWDDEHIRSLLVSIARSFPIGAVMLLETGGEARFKIRPVEGLDPNVIVPSKAEQLILDGQQRLTSLTQVLMLKSPVKTRDDKKRPMDRYYYIDIEKALEGPAAYEEAFVSVEKDKTKKANFGRDIVLDLRTPELEYQNFYFPCNQILNSDSWEEGLNSFDAAKFTRYMEFRKRILNEFRAYNIPVIELKKDNKKEAVCLVFEKVNTGGVPLSVFELITATFAADGVNLRDEWYGSAKDSVTGVAQTFAKQPLLRDVEPTDFFQGLSLLYTYAQRNKDIEAGKSGKQITGVSAKRESVLALPLSAYQEQKDALVAGFIKVAKFLRKESFFSKRDLPYRTQLVPLAAVLTILKERWLEPKIYDKISRWYWCGVLGELYGSAVEGRFALDLQELLDWIDGGTALPSTIIDANFQPGRLDTLRSRNSAAYKGINVLIQRNGAQDFFWKSTIRELDESDWQDHNLDIHHIFPKDWCRKHGIEPKRFNSILNKTPISYKANRMIGGKSPSEYLKQLQNHKNVQLDDAGMTEILRTHHIDAPFLRSDDYEGFIESRRNLLIMEIGQAMGKEVVSTGEAVAEDDIEDGEDS
ncbi:MAG: DUF262 domain-containing protein [Planctomycetales bacterium]|nr:DUF262 domain-containing protein [Planctomycetales bacterium]